MRWIQFLTPVKNMEAEEAKSFISNKKEGDYILLDVRQPTEYENSRIPGASLIPLPQLPDRLGELDRDKPVLVY